MNKLNKGISIKQFIILYIAFSIPAFLCGIATGKVMQRTIYNKEKTDEFLSVALQDCFSAMLDIGKIDNGMIEELRSLRYRSIERNLEIMKRIMSDPAISNRNTDVAKGILGIQKFLETEHELSESHN